MLNLFEVLQDKHKINLCDSLSVTNLFPSIKLNCRDITEILLKEALNIQNPHPIYQPFILNFC
jgi:hypothetical protein